MAERVSLVWDRLARDDAKVAGASSHDRGLIEELDNKPHPVFFTDDLTFLKSEMIADEANPYQKVYFVDVEVSRAKGKIASYRVIGYHGKDDLRGDDDGALVSSLE